MAQAKRPTRTFEGRKPQALGRAGHGMNLSGPNIRQARLARDPQWSQEELSAAVAQRFGLELSATTISKIERAERSLYDFELRALCAVLGLDANDILNMPTT
ncbi:helix-turn-helix domain-containing protein [Deinococcus petrolearius]|uniref:Helix-turn-helix domain-containing protein n=1 Tax=Deinococcus petrolearius TaxID=1751295 RepID=A0ABW1DKJ3_9DEIO